MMYSHNFYFFFLEFNHIKLKNSNNDGCCVVLYFFLNFEVVYFLTESPLGKTHIKNIRFFSGRTTKVLPSLH